MIRYSHSHSCTHAHTHGVIQSTSFFCLELFQKNNCIPILIHLCMHLKQFNISHSSGLYSIVHQYSGGVVQKHTIKLENCDQETGDGRLYFSKIQNARRCQLSLIMMFCDIQVLRGQSEKATIKHFGRWISLQITIFKQLRISYNNA